MFPCTKCGICCKNLNEHDLYKEMDRGDGICINLNESDDLCRIYKDRPLICRIDEMHEAYFKNIKKEDYILSNVMACHKAQIAAGLPAKKVIKLILSTKGK